MAQGVCKDRLADAFERFGRVPIVRRTTAVGRDHAVFHRKSEGPLWASGGLVHDGKGHALLIRHDPASGWGDDWLTPGGWLEEGETTVDGLRREVREEVGIELAEPVLTRILLDVFTQETRTRATYFAQFVARASSLDLRLASDVRDARWFDELPAHMAFREDYVEDLRRLRGGTF